MYHPRRLGHNLRALTATRSITRPFLQESVDTVRVLNIRMAHSHLSTLTSVFISVSVGERLFVVKITHGGLKPGENFGLYGVDSHRHTLSERLALLGVEASEHIINLATARKIIADAERSRG